MQVNLRSSRTLMAEISHRQQLEMASGPCQEMLKRGIVQQAATVPVEQKLPALQALTDH